MKTPPEQRDVPNPRLKMEPHPCAACGTPTGDRYCFRGGVATVESKGGVTTYHYTKKEAERHFSAAICERCIRRRRNIHLTIGLLFFAAILAFYIAAPHWFGDRETALAYSVLFAILGLLAAMVPLTVVSGPWELQGARFAKKKRWQTASPTGLRHCGLPYNRFTPVLYANIPEGERVLVIHL